MRVTQELSAPNTLLTGPPARRPASGTPTASSPARPAAGISLATVAGGALVVVAFLIAARPLSDNSFLTHLATGRLILGGHFPHTDPYSFTAHGSPWVVQSWIPSVIYAGLEKLGGGAAIRLFSGALAAALTAMVWRLTSPAKTLVPRVAIAGLTVCVGAGLWATRPYMFSLVLLAATLLIVRDELRPMWLVPMFWIWVNSHGAWPLGLVLLAVLVIGRKLDGESITVPLRALKWAVLGTVLGAVGPLGPRALTFPVELLGRQKVLSSVQEWQAPSFTSVPQKAFLLAALAAVICIARRPKYRNALLVAVFVGAALLGLRNVVVASVVLVPVLAEGMSGFGSVTGDRRSRVATMAGVVLVAALIVGAVGQARGDAWSLAPYPQRATTYLQQHDLLGAGHRVIARELVGNYWEYRFGTKVPVFFDDRFDMYSDSLNKDEDTLLQARPGWNKVLARWHPDAILWERDKPLTQILQQSADWRVAFRDKNWVVFVPR